MKKIYWINCLKDKHQNNKRISKTIKGINIIRLIAIEIKIEDKFEGYYN